jgi:hypothetical protein
MRRPWDSWAEDDPRYRQLGCLFTIVVSLAAWVAVAVLVNAVL